MRADPGHQNPFGAYFHNIHIYIYYKLLGRNFRPTFFVYKFDSQIPFYNPLDKLVDQDNLIILTPCNEGFHPKRFIC